MNTSKKIGRVIGILQEHEQLHQLLRDMLRAHTAEGFMIARAGMSPAEKWNAVEVLRRDFLAALQLVATQNGIALPGYLRACTDTEDPDQCTFKDAGAETPEQAGGGQ